MSANPKKQVALIIFSTVLAAFSLASIVNFTDPAAVSILTLGFLYLSLFLFALGVFTLTGLFLKTKFSPGLYVNDLKNSFRQGILVALLIVLSFWLLSEKILFWWVEGSLILFFVFIEAFFNLKI